MTILTLVLVRYSFFYVAFSGRISCKFRLHGRDSERGIQKVYNILGPGDRESF